jgi:hypothetical protein
MADIEIACPHCGEQLEASDDMIGQSVDCPSCGQVFEVDAGAGGDEGDAPETCPSCGEPMESDAVLCLQCGYHTGLGRQMDTEVE